MTEGEIVARVECRRKWTPEEKAALMAEVAAEGGRVKPVARRHRMSESLLYNWRSAWRAAASAAMDGAAGFVPVGMIAAPGPVPVSDPPAPGTPTGTIEIALGDGILVRVGTAVDEGGVVACVAMPAGGGMISLPPGCRAGSR